MTISGKRADNRPKFMQMISNSAKGLNNYGNSFTYHFVNWLLKKHRYIGEYFFNGTVKANLKQTKEISNVMTAIKSGIVTKSTKFVLEKLEEEQERLEIFISQKEMKRPIISRKNVETWIMKFAKTELNSHGQRQKIIDVFVNSVYVYGDKMVVFLNYKDWERCVILVSLTVKK